MKKKQLKTENEIDKVKHVHITIVENNLEWTKKRILT